MTCGPLPSTGLDTNVALFLVIGIGCLVAGATLLLVRRRGRGASAILVSLLVLGAGTSLTTLAPDSPAEAASGECSSSGDYLSLTQTSDLAGLAPGIAPAPITGRLVNHRRHSIRITAVEVTITSITSAPGAPAGACSASDYRLTAARMQVGRILTPGASTPFGGASLGFADRTSNQDACQGATVHLLYSVSH